MEDLMKFSKKMSFILAFFLVSLIIVLPACENAGKSGTRKTKQTQAGKTKELPIRTDSPLLKVTPDFKGFNWPAPKKIDSMDMRDLRVYFFLLDRFYDGDKSNNFDVEKGNMKAWNGGDLKGATEKLKYIKDLGYNAIWISPIVDNDEPPAGNVWWFYHGYHFKDPYTVDEHFGKNSDFVAFVVAAHKLGIKVLLDVVVNHSGHTFKLRPRRNAAFKSWFNDPLITMQQNEVKGSILGAPDFDQSNPHAAAFLIDYIKFWISKAKIDGLRLDTVKHVNKPFWKKFSREIKKFAGKGFFLMGEVYDWQIPGCKPFLDLGLDSLVDFPLYPKITHVFGKDGSMNTLSKALQSDKQWKNAFDLGTFIDNHDVARLTDTVKKDPKKMLKSALAFIYTIRGFPVVYYGSEIAMKGGAENNNAGRKMMPWKEIAAGKYNDMISYVKALNKIRGNSKALRRGKLTEVYKDYSVFAYIRSVRGEAILTIINKNPAAAKYVFKLPAEARFQGIKKDLLGNEKFRFSGNKLKITLKARTSYIFQAKGGKALRARLVKFNKRMPSGIKMVTFSIKKPAAKEIMLAGDFNGWDQKSTPLKKGNDGTFSLTMPLKPGRYNYKFIIDGNWTADPAATETSGPPYNNSVKIVK